MQLQENNNSSSRDAKKPQEGLGPDEMWAPGALGHHRELPVDVPDTLLQKAYPNKVKHCSSEYRNGLQHRPRSASDLDLSLNLKNETLKTRTIADARVKHVPNDHTHDEIAARTINARNGLQPSVLTIELNMGDEKEEVKSKGSWLDKYRDSPATTDSLNLKSNFKVFGEDENADTEAQKESSVDVEDDYPFAKEDYPTMLKTCSDDSASPRSSSGRSDSTAPLDTSLMIRGNSKNHKDSPIYDVRRIDLGSPCRSVVPDIKVAPLFGRNRDATSFDNPAYGLTDLQDLQGLLRSDEVTDLTRLIDEQCSIPRLPTDQDKVSPVRAKDQQTESPQTESPSKSGKTPKRRPHDERAKLKAKTRSLDIEALIRASSTDDLLGIELNDLSSSSSSSRQRPGKKKRHEQISSGYSTLKSEASGDLEHNTDRSFLVVGGRSYREVAVDCPPDFVPVTKCHPVYPPPNKTPANSKHNTLEPKRDRVGECASVANEGNACATTATTTTTTSTLVLASLCQSPNHDNSSTKPPNTDGSSRETAVARTIDRKHNDKKVRSRVKSLLIDGLNSITQHAEHSRASLPASATTRRSNAASQPAQLCTRAFVVGHALDPKAELPQTTLSQTVVTTSSDDREGGKLYYDNFYFDQFLENAKHSALREELPENWRDPALLATDDKTSVASSETFGDFTRSYARFDPPRFLANSPTENLSRHGILQIKPKKIFSPCSYIEIGEPNVSSSNNDDDVRCKLATDNDHDELSFVQETNQNSRNSLRESSAKLVRAVRHSLFDDTRDPTHVSRSRDDERPDHNVDRSMADLPSRQNQKNLKLSFKYKISRLLNGRVSLMLHNNRNNVKIRAGRRPLSKSLSDLSNLIDDQTEISKIPFSNLVSRIASLRRWNREYTSVDEYFTKQSARISPTHAVENRSRESHIEAVEHQVKPPNRLCQTCYSDLLPTDEQFEQLFLCFGNFNCALSAEWERILR